LHAGQNDLAGELGHWRLASEGPVGFGKAGSFEGFCSGGGLRQLAEQKQASTTDVKALAETARNGDVVAQEIFALSGQKLGEGLALVVDLLNPEVIVLGSIFVRCEDLIRPAMEAALRREAIGLAVDHCRIVPALLDEQIGDYAALAVAMNVS
jgi:Transcriptional regulator/sugar kinase